MTPEETSTVAAALTVKPALNTRNAVIAVVTTAVVVAGVVGVVKWKKRRDAQNAADDIVENNALQA